MLDDIVEMNNSTKRAKTAFEAARLEYENHKSTLKEKQKALARLLLDSNSEENLNEVNE